MSYLRKVVSALVLAFVVWLIPSFAFAQDDVCDPIATEPIVAAGAQQAQAGTLLIDFTVQDCEMLGTFQPFPEDYPDLKIERLQILRKFDFTATEVDGDVKVVRAKGLFMMPIGKDTGSVFHNYEYGPDFEDTVQDASFWNIRDSKTVPSIKHQETMVVHAALLAVIAKEAGLKDFEVKYVYADFPDAYAVTYDPSSRTDCSFARSTTIVDPNPDRLSGEATVGYERMLYLLQFSAHEAYHNVSKSYNQALGSEVTLGYGVPEESFAEAFMNQALDKLISDSTSYQALWKFNFFKGADVAKLKEKLTLIQMVRQDYFAARWSSGNFETYVFWPVVDFSFPDMAKVVQNLATHCHKDIKVSDVANDYGITVSWQNLVAEQVADCLYEGATSNGLLRNYCRVETFSPGVQTLQSGYVCFDSIDDSHRIARLTATAQLWYLFGSEYGAWDDWFRANNSDFIPKDHSNNYEPVGGTRFCLVAGTNAAIFNLTGDPVVLDKHLYLPAINR